MIGSKAQPQESRDDLVVVGRVRRPTGIKGAMLVEVYSGNPNRFVVGDIIVINGSDHEIVGTGKSGKSAKIQLAGINSIESAVLFRDEEISVTADSLPDNPPGVYYHYEIMNADVVTVDGKQLGTLTEILETGSNDVFVVSRKGDSTRKSTDAVLIPVLEGVIVSVDSKNGVMTINPPEGLF